MLSFFVIVMRVAFCVLRVAFCVLRVACCVLRLIVCLTGPRGKAAAVAAKNSPPDCFLHAPIARCVLRFWKVLDVRPEFSERLFTDHCSPITTSRHRDFTIFSAFHEARRRASCRKTQHDLTNAANRRKRIRNRFRFRRSFKKITPTDPWKRGSGYRAEESFPTSTRRYRPWRAFGSAAGNPRRRTRRSASRTPRY